MVNQVIIVGASGHGKVVADIIRLSGDIVFGFLDDDITKKEFLGYPVFGNRSNYEKYLDKQFIVAIGNPYIREKIVRSMQKAKWYTAIHPHATISSENTFIGNGSVVMANAVINPCATVGCHCIINTGAIVEHDNIISDYAHISVGAKLAGAVSIGQRTWIGIGSSISNGISICDDCMIGAGCVVVRNIFQPGTYVGIPANQIK